MPDPQTTITAQKTRVFISYARVEDMAFADALVSALEQHDIEVLIDRRDLPYGDEWKPELLGFVRRADAIVFIVSPSSIASHWCQWELEQVKAESKRLVPIVLESVPLADLPAEIADINLLPFVQTWNAALGVRDIFSSRAKMLAMVLLSNRAWIKEHTCLGELARRWRARCASEADGSNEGLLLRGSALSEAELWISRRPREAPEPSELQRTFIQESRKAEQARADREREQLLKHEQELNEREQRIEREREQLLKHEQELNEREQRIEREREQLLKQEQELNEREPRIEREREQLLEQEQELNEREPRIEREREQLLEHEQELNDREQRIEREREQLLKHELNEREQGIPQPPKEDKSVPGSDTHVVRQPPKEHKSLPVNVEMSPPDTHAVRHDDAHIIRRLAASAAEMNAALDKSRKERTSAPFRVKRSTSGTRRRADSHTLPETTGSAAAIRDTGKSRQHISTHTRIALVLLLLVIALGGLAATEQIYVSDIVQQLRRAIPQ